MKCSAILGPAGSGKSTQTRERAAAAGDSVKLCATTGIAAVNLGPSVTTLHSLLGFFDVASLEYAKTTGRFGRRLRQVSAMYNVIDIDEISMLPADVLDSIVDGFRQAERETGIESPDIVAIGDFLQLPPVNAPFAFEARAWGLFAASLTQLHGSYRQQTDPSFFYALQCAREGRGIDAVIALKKAGIGYRTKVDPNYAGLTISAMNSSVDKINRERFAKVSGVERSYQRAIAGVELSDWKTIPARVLLKKGALVMLLANKTDRDAKELEYVNGDSGVVEEMTHSGVTVRLERNGVVVAVEYVRRRNMARERGINTQAVFDAKEGRWEIGHMSYLPVRLAYASTIHKAQGLTLGRVQIDARTIFAGEPGMMYTALSRCREAKDIVVVTKSAGDFARRIQTHPKVRQYI